LLETSLTSLSGNRIICFTILRKLLESISDARTISYFKPC
jgi:hypothetical protein